MPTIDVFFAGNFSLRLATNPDPFDEPRGRAGRTRAYPGEPDLDRIIRFAPHTGYIRTPAAAGLSPVSIYATSQPGRALTGMVVALEPINNVYPRFEGRDGVVAEPGFEPVIPLKVAIKCNGTPLLAITYCNSIGNQNQNVKLDSRFVGTSLSDELKTKAVALRNVWKMSSIDIREQALRALVGAPSTPAPDRATISDRLQRYFNGSLLNYFGNNHAQVITCDSPIAVEPNPALPLADDLRPDTSSGKKWPLTLCFFGFDEDALAGICVGKMTIPLL